MMYSDKRAKPTALAAREQLFRHTLARPQLPIIDCHINLGASDSGELHYPHLGEEEYLQLMDEAGVERACALPPLQVAGYRAANERLLQATGASGGKLAALARLGGRRTPLMEPHLWRFRKKARAFFKPRPCDVDDLDGLRRFAGVKLAPHMDGVPSDDELAWISEARMPVLVHAGLYSSPAWIEHTLIRRLRGPVVMAHLGSFPCEERMLREAVDIVARHRHVYMDTSGVWMAAFVRYAVERVPDRLMFGSDAPLAHPLVAWYHLASVVQDDKTLEKIGYGAAKEVFFG